MTGCSYVDTSIIVAALDPRDRRQAQAQKLLSGIECKVVSELVLVELASVISRRLDILKRMISAMKMYPEDERLIMAVLLYLMKRFDLKCLAMQELNIVEDLLCGYMYLPIREAIRIAPMTGLRTLDLLHVVYALTMKRLGIDVAAFITADKDFERARDLFKRWGIKLVILQGT